MQSFPGVFLLLEQKTTQRSHQPFKKGGYQGRVRRVENHPPLQEVGQSELHAEPIRGKIVIVEGSLPNVSMNERRQCSPTTIRKRKLASKKLVVPLFHSFQGLATTFIINQMIENNGVFPREAISTLCHLAVVSNRFYQGSS